MNCAASRGYGGAVVEAQSHFCQSLMGCTPLLGQFMQDYRGRSCAGFEKEGSILHSVK